MSVSVFIVLWVLPDLRLVEPVQYPLAHLPVLVQIRETRLHGRLGEEGQVPQLTPVGPRHEHPFFRQPEEILHPGQMHLERLGFRAVMVISHNHVERLGHRSKGLIRRVLILVLHHLVRLFNGHRSKRQAASKTGERRERLVEPDDLMRNVEDRVVRRVYIDRVDIVTLSRPVDRFVWLHVDLLPKTEDERGDGTGESLSEQVTHRGD